jgi:hypothetical protein
MKVTLSPLLLPEQLQRLELVSSSALHWKL